MSNIDEDLANISSKRVYLLALLIIYNEELPVSLDGGPKKLIKQDEYESHKISLIALYLELITKHFKDGSTKEMILDKLKLNSKDLNAIAYGVIFKDKETIIRLSFGYTAADVDEFANNIVKNDAIKLDRDIIEACIENMSSH